MLFFTARNVNIAFGSYQLITSFECVCCGDKCCGHPDAMVYVLSFF